MTAIWMNENHVTVFDDEKLIAFRVSREQAIREITNRGYSEVFAANTLDFGIPADAWRQFEDELQREAS